MIRALISFALAVGLSGCGLMLDGVYLISNKRFSRDERQTKPTELTQTAFEHTVRAEQGQVWLACEDTERSVDRVWTVHKEYEHVGGFHLVHFVPLFLDTIIGGALGVGFGIECGKGNSCTPLIAVAPLAVDAIYSAIRLAMIEPPKLVNKERRSDGSAPSETVNWRKTVSCEPDAVVMIGRSEADPLAAWFRVDAWGAMNPAEQPRLVDALIKDGARVFWAAGGKAPQVSSLSRCDVLRALNRGCPESASR